MRLACLQFAPIFGRIEQNLAAIERLAEHPRADLVVLPELCTTGYTFANRAELEDLSEEVPGGPSTTRFTRLAARTGATYCFGIAERAGRALFNSAALVGPQGFIGVYRKVHLYDRETLFFEPGDLGFRTFDVCGVPVGVMICFDWIFPESTRTLALRGAKIVAHPSNLVLPWCQESMPVRCRENRIFAATANRFGVEERASTRLVFTGASQITGVLGEVLAAAGAAGEAWIDAEIEPERADDRAVGLVPDLLAHRRPEAYAS